MLAAGVASSKASIDKSLRCRVTQKPPAAGAVASSGTLWHLQPNPLQSANALYMFTNKKVDFQLHEYMAMHEHM